MKVPALFASLLLSLCSHAQLALLILGTAQDGGYPQAGCIRECCKPAWENTKHKRNASCIALYEKQSNKAWLFDITPDFKEQWQMLKQKTNDSVALAGIFLTHAHVGHYAGLIHLGREVMGSNAVQVYALPRMKQFLESNGPWSQLVKLNNIHINTLYADSTLIVNSNVQVTAYTVPHRDEYSETAAFMIAANNTRLLYLPDIDKWEKWNKNVAELTNATDMAFVDATFWSTSELPGRSMDEIPHPLVTESMMLLRNNAHKIHFIHLNHSNPLLQEKSPERVKLKNNGFNMAEQGQMIEIK